MLFGKGAEEEKHMTENGEEGVGKEYRSYHHSYYFLNETFLSFKNI